MGVFDGDVYRIRSRMKHTIAGHTVETRATRYADTESEARDVVDDWREYGVDAVQVDHLMFAHSGSDPGLSFGDYDGDEEDE